MARQQLRRTQAALLDARVALGQWISSALHVLEAPATLSDQSVHAVRKDLKRARAALRLLRDAIGDAAYARENAALRDASRPLAPLRDARVSLDTVRSLLKAEKDPQRRALLVGESRALRAERKAVRAAAGDARERQELARALQQVSERAGRWRLPREVWPVVREGIERIYRKGRKALGNAQSRPTDANLHEARKQVKYLGAAMQILAAAHARRAERLAARADSIAERLGDDHDLALVQRRIAGVPRQRGNALVNDVKQRRKTLQKRALQRAHRLYRRKPARFLHRLERSPTSGP